MDGIQTNILQAKIEAIVSSPARLRVAKLLAALPEKEFTGRELARAAGLSHSTALAALDTLVTYGYALVRVLGRAHGFRANPESYLVGAIREWMRIEESGAAELVSELRQRLRDVASTVIIFGSYARGTATSGSDLDVLILTRKRQAVEARLPSVEGALVRRFGILLSAKVIEEAEWSEKRRLPYVREALKVGVPVFGRITGRGVDG